MLNNSKIKMNSDEDDSKVDKQASGEENTNEAVVDVIKSLHSFCKDIVETFARKYQITSVKYFNAKDLKYFQGDLYDYQVEGVFWLIRTYRNGFNGILADEMGLGKTIQIIALIAYMIQEGVRGFNLVVCPLSTISNWESEFKRFGPKIPVIKFYALKENREELVMSTANKCVNLDGKNIRPVIITSYEMLKREVKFFQNITFEYVILDEGQRIKNQKSGIYKCVQCIKSTARVILTGTPLQNNIQELWSLLSYLMPDFFINIGDLSSLYLFENFEDYKKFLKEEEKQQVISTMHKLLSPFILRRTKKSVLNNMPPKKEILIECPLSDVQRNLYIKAIEKNINVLRGETSNTLPDKRKRKRPLMLNLLDPTTHKEYLVDDDQKIVVENGQKYVTRPFQFSSFSLYKHLANHPYIVKLPLDPRSDSKQLLVDENLINISGKFMILDMMLPKLKRNSHKVLLFSTSIMALDFVEELLIYRGFKYSRLDGTKIASNRVEEINKFKKDPSVFIFLMSTRAGGLGLNLTEADTVIFLDRDWNPQMDIQAQDRCYRIGQKKPIMVYTLVAKDTIDERIIQQGKNKIILEKLIIHHDKFTNYQPHQVNFQLESELIKLKETLENTQHKLLSHEDLDKILDRSELYKMWSPK